MSSIKDFIYFDYDKIKSISSQISGGLIQEISHAFEDENSLNGNMGFNFQVLKGNGGGKTVEKVIKTEKIELYHEILNQLENSLFEKELLTNINENFYEGKRPFNEFKKGIENFSFIKATGWFKFEDFEKLKLISSNINEISKFINYEHLKNNLELNSLREQLNDKKKEIKSNKSSQHKDFLQLSSIEKKLDKLVSEKLNLTLFDEAWIEGLKTFLDTFSPNRLNLRVQPFDEFNDFQILSSLKEECLTTGNYDRIIYTYGSRPNIKLTILGILTSCPAEIDKRKHPDDEFLYYDDNELTESQVFEKAFRNMFSTFENLDKFFFVPTFPKIGIYTLAIYREIFY